MGKINNIYTRIIGKVVLFMGAITIIIIVLLLFVFAFMPKEGMVAAEATYESVSVKSALFQGKLKTQDCWMYSHRDSLYMTPAGVITINGQQYMDDGKSSYSIRVMNNIDHEKGKVHFLFDNPAEVRVEYSSHENDIYVVPNVVEFNNTDNNCYSDAPSFLFDMPCRVEFENCYGELIIENFEKGTLEHIRIDDVFVNSGGIFFAQKDNEGNSKNESSAFGWSGIEDFIFWNSNKDNKKRNIVNRIRANGEGKVSLFMTAKMQEYELLGDTSAEGEITVVVRDGKLKYEGRATSATINDYSIFPGFRDWLINNYFLIPSLLISIIGGAITLAKNVEENKKDSNN